MQRLTTATVVISAGLALSSVAHAADRNWNNANGGVFGSPTNWSEAAAPGPLDRAIFDIPGTYTVTFPVSAATTWLVGGRGDVTLQFQNQSTYFVSSEFTLGDLAAPPATMRIRNGGVSASAVRYPLLDGNTATIDVAGGGGAGLFITNQLTVAERGVGNLNVSDGTVSAANTTVCASGSSSGTVTVGLGGQWTSGQFLFLGLGGDPTLNVNTGGTAACGTLRMASQFTSQAVANISGQGALFQAFDEMDIGDGGTATINVSGGGKLITNVTRVGSLAGGMGHVNITGAASRWEPGISLQVGASGTGTATIEGQAQVLPQQAGFVGVDAGSNGTLTVRQAGTLVSIPSAQLQVGRDGIGTLVVENGGEVRSSGSTSPSQTGAIIGLQNAGNGTATITGSGSKWTVQGGSMVAGWASNGTLRVQNGGLVTSVEGYVGRLAGSVGVAEISGAGSSWTCTGDLRVGLGPSNAAGGTGTLRVQSGGTAMAPTIRVGATGTLAGDSTVQGAVNVAGVTAPGSTTSPTGQLSVQGPYTQTSGATLRIDLAGTTPGTQHDVLAVSGAASIAGTLVLNLVSGFSPPGGTTFTVLTAPNVTGTFSTVQASPPLSASWEVIYEPGAVKVRAAGAACPGDANGDRRVDFLDLNIVLSFFGQNVPVGTSGDLNADGQVTFIDLNIVLSFFGHTCGA
ncbi:MAG: hypothetical protein AB7G17_03520 [Phycisphaerales bacterium]